jgi:hypothetical protein
LFVRPDPEDAVPCLGIGDGRLEEIKEEYRQHSEATGRKAAADLCDIAVLADPQRPVEYLAWHGLDAEGRVVPRTHEEVGHALLSAAQEIEASLLVMGGYAHIRFEEAVFDGTTLHAMLPTHLPLSMMH